MDGETRQEPTPKVSIPSGTVAKNEVPAFMGVQTRQDPVMKVCGSLAKLAQHGVLVDMDVALRSEPTRTQSKHMAWNS